MIAKLALRSGGNHAFVADNAALVGVFEREFNDVLSVKTQKVRLDITCADGVRPIRVLGREAEINGNRVYIPLNQLYAGKEKYVVLEVEVSAKPEQESVDLAQLSVSYTDLVRGGDQTKSARLTVGFSQTSSKVDASINRDVMEAFYTQLAAVQNDEAIRIRDTGDIAKAKDTMLENARILESASKLYKSEKLAAQASESKKQTLTLDDTAAWNKQRKTLKEMNNKLNTQQTWDGSLEE